VENIKSGEVNKPEDKMHLPKYMPPVIDKQAYDAIMGMNQRNFQEKMAGF